MQATESITTTPAAAVLQQDLDLTQYVPDFLQPLWNFFLPYPWLLTLILVAAAWLIGKLLKAVITRTIMRLVAKTSSDADDRLVEYLTKPLVLTVIVIALLMSVSLYHLPPGLRNATIAILGTIVLFSWLRASLRAARVLLQLLASNSHRFELIQDRTIPIFDMTIKVLLVGLAAYFILLIWGINPTAWLASAGVIGIAVGFAAKDSLANLFSGIFIVADAPYKVGDYIVLDSGERGQVTNLGMRSTRLLTRDDIEVTVPNAVIANAKIINESGGPWVKHRIRVAVGVAYGSDVDQVCEVLEGIAKEHPEIAKEPAARVRMRGFGDSSLDFELMGWIDHPQLRGRVRHELMKSIYKTFNREGIEIPFPQTDIYVRSLPERPRAEG